MGQHPNRRRTTLVRRLFLVAASFVLGIAGWFLLGESESSAISEGPARSVLARIDGIAITEEEVLTLAADEFAALERRRQELLSKTAREVVHRRLIAAEAARRGLSVPELLAEGRESPEAYSDLIARLERGHTIEYLTLPADVPEASKAGS